MCSGRTPSAITRRNAPQQRPLQELHEKRGLWPLALERRADDVVLHQDLYALGDARGKFTALLHSLKCSKRYSPAEQGLNEDIGGGDRILYRQINADAADGRHGVGGVSYAEQPRPVPATQPVNGNR